MEYQFSDLHFKIFESKKQLNIIKAVAGSGKTTTMIELAKRNKSKKYIYITYNTSAANDVSSKGIPNIFASTFHSIAAKKYLPMYRDKIKDKITIKDVLKTISLKINPENVLIARAVLETINKFQNSDCLKIRDVVKRNLKIPRDTIILYSEIVWSCMIGVDFDMPCTHDTYLKLFHLNKDIIDGLNIIFDEAQDASNVMIAILTHQMIVNKTTLFVVGDENQSIYQFRYSNDAIKAFQSLRFEKEIFYLNKSYRFGENISNLANDVLRLKGIDSSIIGSGGTDLLVKKIGVGKKVAIIARKNETVFEMAIKTADSGKKMFFIGGFDSYSMSNLSDIENLYLGKRGKIVSQDVRDFKSYNDFEKMAFSTQDFTMMKLCSIVRSYAGKIDLKIKLIKSNIVNNVFDAEVILTNAHKSKGLEFDNVYLCNDFKSYYDKNGNKLAITPNHNEELNLLYVALTRAKKRLRVNKTLEQIIKNK